MQVTKREILFSIIILCVSMVIALLINSAITNSIEEENELYYRALKIENDQAMFTYGMETNVGNALASGTFSVVDPVTMPEITGVYWYIEKHTERYTQHTRTVTTTDSKGHSTTHIETYYSWDGINTSSDSSKQFTFLGNAFPTTKISPPSAYNLNLNETTVSVEYRSWIGSSGNYLYQDGDWWASVGDLRYSFDVTPTQINGTILAKLTDNDMYNITNKTSPISIEENKNISQIIEYRKNLAPTTSVIFFIVWGLVSAGGLFAFYYAENNWLEDKFKNYNKKGNLLSLFAFKRKDKYSIELKKDKDK